MLPVVSHRRSGTHLAMTYLSQFYGKDCQKYHTTPESPESSIYIVRDGRDVLTSCFFWWKSSGESMKSNIGHNFKGKTISQFLNGEIEPEGYRFTDGLKPEEVKLGIIDNPIYYWVHHVQKHIFQLGMRYIRYEHMLSDLQKIFGEKDIKPISNLVGHDPRKGIIGDYKNYFSDEDLYFFDFVAGKTMEILGYNLES